MRQPGSWKTLTSADAQSSSPARPASKELPLPKDIMAFDFSPSAGSNLAEIQILMANRPGMLRSVASVLAESGVQILSGFHNAPATAENGVWTLFADCTTAKVPFEKIAEVIKSVDGVTKVQHKQSNGGLIVESFHFPAMFGPTRAVVLTTEALTGTIARLRRDFGTAASVILFDMGLAMGEQSADNALKYLGENQSKEFSEDFAKLYAAMGWGIATLVKSDHEEKKEILDLQNCFECEPFRNGDVRSNSQLVRGFVNGAANIAFAKPCYTREVDCIAKGDERCRFVTALP